MFDFDLKLINNSDDLVTLRLPMLFYITFSVISISVFATIILYGGSVFSYILLFVSVAALTYRESWVFSKTTKGSYYKTGIGFVYNKLKFNLKDVELLEYTTFTKGKTDNKSSFKYKILNKRYHSLKIHMSNGKDYTLLTVNDSKKTKLDDILVAIQYITESKVEK